MVKAITEYVQVPWEHMGRALASALGIREVLPLKVSTERIGARVSQRCECVCVCVCCSEDVHTRKTSISTMRQRNCQSPHHRVLSSKVIRSEALFRKLPLTIVRKRIERKVIWRLLNSVTSNR